MSLFMKQEKQMKKVFISAAIALATIWSSLGLAQASQYYKFGPNGYTNSYTDFSGTTSSGSTFNGTIYRR
jgi:hypothetical protein